MSKVLVIPDVHLKPWMFDQAHDIMENTDCEIAVCLGDIVDDWGCEHDVKLYEETLKKAIRFASRYPDTFWCLGNHDLAYMWDQYDHPGYSSYAADTVCDMFETLRDTLESPENLAIIHKMDNVIFSHAGICTSFVEAFLYDVMDDIDYVIDTINGFGAQEMWVDDSPIWVRPQDWDLTADMLYPQGFLQVVGHTPVKRIVEQDNMITLDVFSTYSDGTKIGNEEFYWVDTVSRKYGPIDV